VRLIDLIDAARASGITLSPTERQVILQIGERIANGSNNPRRPQGVHQDAVDEALGSARGE
jgi:hypothetical protein